RVQLVPLSSGAVESPLLSSVFEPLLSSPPLQLAKAMHQTPIFARMSPPPPRVSEPADPTSQRVVEDLHRCAQDVPVGKAPRAFLEVDEDHVVAVLFRRELVPGIAQTSELVVPAVRLHDDAARTDARPLGHRRR